MLATSATRPARLSETMRRVRLEKDSAKKYCQARCSQLNGRCQPLTCGVCTADASWTSDGAASSVCSPGWGGVRSSTGKTAGYYSGPAMQLTAASYPGWAAAVSRYLHAPGARQVSLKR